MELVTAGDVGAPQLRVDLDGHPGAIAWARDAADAFLTTLAQSMPPAGDRARDDVLLVVSELVTNAVRHAPGPLTLRLAHVVNGVRVSVRDTGAALPRFRSGDLEGGTGGFGWSIVRRLAHSLEVVPQQDGKEVHAVLPW